ncbi:MAG: hypothetical protein P4L51_06300 [Puia sp.]|nr:hypothetical protein [Puia sp.]
MDPITRIDTVKLAERWNPFVQTVWVTMKTPVRRWEIEKALRLDNLLSPEAPKPPALFGLWDLSPRKDHIGRIAWFVRNFDDTFPIEVDFGIPSWGIPLCLRDGNHRLAAALFIEKPFINANCAGAIHEIEKMTYSLK